MKKVLLTILLMIFGLGLTLNIVYANPQNINEASQDTVILSVDSPVILADVAEVLERTNFEYRINDQATLLFSQATLTAFSEQVVITPSTIEVNQKGIYQLLIQDQGLTFEVYLITKESSETEYVIYEENFDEIADHDLPSGYQVTSGTAEVIDGQLILKGRGGTGLLTLPSYLKGFTNYIIESEFSILEQDNNTRWASVMFRYTPENYFQMAIRKQATLTNGVEFAKRIAGSWNVAASTSLFEDIDPQSLYQIKIEVEDAVIREFINDELLIEYGQAVEYQKGLIGMQAAGSNALYDNVKITLPVSYLRADNYVFTQIPSVYMVETGIVNPATLVVELKEESDLTNLLQDQRPATLILNVNEDLDVIDANQNVIKSLYEILIDLDGLFIPAIRIKHTDTAEAVAEKLRLWAIIDVFIISDDARIIQASRRVHPVIRGILDYSLNTDELTDVKLNQIRDMTNQAEAVAVILNEEVINKKAVNYLQQRLITVWSTSDVDADVNRYRVIFSGVNGIVSDYYEKIFSIYQSITATTHVREVFVIAHRGLHNGYNQSSGPENSLEVAIKSVKQGAKIIEIDVHLTSDQEVVVIHDETINRTTNQTGFVASMTLETLESINLTDVSNTANTFKIPSYQAYLEAFKDQPEVVLFVEIKPTNKTLLERVKSLTEAYDMTSQVVFIMFEARNAEFLSEVMPEVSRGLLTGGLVTNNLETSLRSVLTRIAPIKTTLNHSYNTLTKELVYAMTHRGITVWPWTIDDSSAMSYFYNAGVGGITTNVCDNFAEIYLYMTYQQTKVVIEQGSEFRIEGQIMTFNRQTYQYRGNMVILVNDANANFDQTGKLVDSDLGVVVYYTTMLTALPSGGSIEIMSDIMTLEIIESSSPSNQMMWLYLGVGVFLIVSLLGIMVFTLKRKKA